MGVFGDRVLPALLDAVMRRRRFAAYRHRALAGARGLVLEIGVGTGLNLPFYGAEVRTIIGLDPHPRLLGLARRRAGQGPCAVHLVQGSAESLPLADNAIDTVVTTWSLCSIPDPLAALREMRRVLRPDGRLHFVEHGLAPDPGVRKWQRRLTPCWTRVSGGCHLDRKMDDLIRAAGFHLGDLADGYMAGPRLVTFMYEGRARPGR